MLTTSVTICQRSVEHQAGASARRRAGPSEAPTVPVRFQARARSERAVVSFDWSGLGEVGDVRVMATALSSVVESRSDNNAIAAESFVFVGGLGFGVDALNGAAPGVAWWSNGRDAAGVCVLGACQAL